MTKPPKGGKTAVRDAIHAAEPARPAADGVVIPFQDRTSDRFKWDSDGLYRTAHDKSPFWVASPFEVLAEVRDDSGHGWGLLLTFKDRDGVGKELVVQRRLLVGEGAGLRERLVDAGLDISASQGARAALVEYLTLVRSAHRARTVPQTGWHRLQGGLVFVQPETVFGEAAERVVLQAEDRVPHAFRHQGTLDDWKREVGARCAGNSRLTFAVSCALAAPLLHMADMDGSGFNLKGASRLGKTTGLRVASSVWGGEPGQGATAFVRQWRSTSNGLEGIAATHTDCLLALDELGQMDAKEAGETAYMLASGRGKSRAGRTGVTRPELRWRVLILSTGEEGIADRNAEAGKRTRAGQEVRLVDVPADAGAGLGLFEMLHGEVGARDLADRLRKATTEQYGTAAPVWVAWIIGRVRADEAGFRATLKTRRDDLARSMMPAGAGGQVASVASVFALVGVAGEMAAEANVVPWPKTEAESAARLCFEAWLDERGTMGAREDADAETALRAFVQAHGPSRFELWRDTSTEAQDVHERPDLPPAERYKTVHRAGFRRWEFSQEEKRWRWAYYVTTGGMHEALKGLAERTAIATLADKGMLVRDAQGKNSISLQVPGQAKQRLYKITDALFYGSEGDSL